MINEFHSLENIPFNNQDRLLQRALILSQISYDEKEPYQEPKELSDDEINEYINNQLIDF